MRLTSGDSGHFVARTRLSGVVSRLVIASAVMIASAAAVAQEKRFAAPGFPSKPIRVLTGGAAGGGDIITRAVANKLSQYLVQPVVVENIPGAAGNLAVNRAMAAPSDGYTILARGNSILINAVFKSFEEDVLTALVPVAEVSTQPYMIFVPANSPFNTYQELLDFAKKNPGKLNYGSSGIGSVIHMGSELLEYMAGVDMVHVPYKSAGFSSTDLAAGRLDFLFSSVTGLQLMRIGKVKMLAVATPKRNPDFPDKPAIAEFLQGYELANTYLWFAPGKTPASIVEGLNREMIRTLKDEDLRKQMLADGSNPAPARTPAELRKSMAAELKRWESVVKTANIKLDER